MDIDPSISRCEIGMQMQLSEGTGGCKNQEKEGLLHNCQIFANRHLAFVSSSNCHPRSPGGPRQPGLAETCQIHSDKFL